MIRKIFLSLTILTSCIAQEEYHTFVNLGYSKVHHIDLSLGNNIKGHEKNGLNIGAEFLKETKYENIYVGSSVNASLFQIHDLETSYNVLFFDIFTLQHNLTEHFSYRLTFGSSYVFAPSNTVALAEGAGISYKVGTFAYGIYFHTSRYHVDNEPNAGTADGFMYQYDVLNFAVSKEF